MHSFKRHVLSHMCLETKPERKNYCGYADTHRAPSRAPPVACGRQRGLEQAAMRAGAPWAAERASRRRRPRATRRETQTEAPWKRCGCRRTDSELTEEGGAALSTLPSSGHGRSRRVSPHRLGPVAGSPAPPCGRQEAGGLCWPRWRLRRKSQEAGKGKRGPKNR